MSSKRDPVDDRPHDAVLLVADLMEHNPFTHREVDAEVPVLPDDLATVDREARPVRLPDRQRLQTRPLGVGVPGDGRVHGPDAGVDEVDHLASVRVDRDDDSLDRPVVHVR